MPKKHVPEVKTNNSAFKHFFGPDLLKRIANSLANIYPSFNQKSFLNLFSKMKLLEMKSRVKLLSHELRQQLPANYPKALAILLKSAHDGSLNSFDFWPYTEFIQTYGLDHPDLSLNALKKLTILFTSEWAVRPFIKKDPQNTLNFLLLCAQDKDVKVRRWASEGSRPRLPWGERLQDFIIEPAHTLPILETLKSDPDLFVRKSVANHLNDISKDHPEYVIKTLKRWKKQAPSEDQAKIKWIISHALRTLIKAGNPKALELIGVSYKADIKLTHFKIKQKEIHVGEYLEFELELQSLANKPQKLVIDYVMHYIKANKNIACKVFKLKTIEVSKSSILKISKKHHMKKITTRVFYAGIHSLEIQINGKVMGKKNWKLTI